MGHADVSTTMNIYAEANPDVTKSVIEKLSKNMDIFQKRVLRLNSLKIENIPCSERPRERLIKYGAKSLSTEDLIKEALKRLAR